jgi:hypothetical protein
MPLKGRAGCAGAAVQHTVLDSRATALQREGARAGALSPSPPCYAETGSGTAVAALTRPFLWAQRLASVRFATSNFL